MLSRIFQAAVKLLAFIGLIIAFISAEPLYAVGAECTEQSRAPIVDASGELTYDFQSPGCGGGGGGGEGDGAVAEDPCTWIPVELPRGGIDPHHMQCQFDDGTLGPIVNTNGPIQLAISPEQAAWQIVRSIQFEPIVVGMAPKVNPEWGHRRTYVGLPVWLWAAETSSLNYGTHTVNDTVGGLSMNLDAQVDRIVWDMGDGTTVTCGPGTPYSTSFGPVDSPTCGHHYTQTSEHQPGGMYTVTATSYWTVTWNGGGQSGTINFDLSTSTEVEVKELQSVNTNPNGVGG